MVNVRFITLGLEIWEHRKTKLMLPYQWVSLDRFKIKVMSLKLIEKRNNVEVECNQVWYLKAPIWRGNIGTYKNVSSQMEIVWTGKLDCLKNTLRCLYPLLFPFWWRSEVLNTPRLEAFVSWEGQKFTTFPITQFPQLASIWCCS